MKIVIQIPCHNEAQQLPATLAELPRVIPGVDCVEWIVIDDGSTDGTASIAIAHGVDAVVRLPANIGLARAFASGLEAACRRGADIVVNVDADNQYHAAAIPLLVEMIQSGMADVVVGCRPIDRIPHFSPMKKLLQRLGSRVVRIISGLRVADATSGFRAYSREAAMRLNVYSSYTYTLETLIQAGQTRLRVGVVSVEVNPPTRPSRLIKSNTHYVVRSIFTILRAFLTYRPLEFFMVPAGLSATMGVLIGVVFLLDYLRGDGAGHVQSLILAAVLIVIAAVCTAIGLLANQLAVNRRLLEELQLSRRKVEWKSPD